MDYPPQTTSAVLTIIRQVLHCVNEGTVMRFLCRMVCQAEATTNLTHWFGLL